MIMVRGAGPRGTWEVSPAPPNRITPWMDFWCEFPAALTPRQAGRIAPRGDALVYLSRPCSKGRLSAGGLTGCLRQVMRHAGDWPPGYRPRSRWRPERPIRLTIVVVLAFVGGLAALAALVPVGHGFAPKGGGLFIPAVVGGVFTLHPLLVAVPWAACFVSGLVDWRDPWRVEHLDLLALACFFPVAMLLSDDAARAGVWLSAACLSWLFCRMLGVVLGIWRMPRLRPSISSRRLGLAIVLLLLARLASLAGGNILDVGQASSLGAWRLLHGLHLYGAVSWAGPGGFRIYRPDSYGPFAYYAYIPFVIIFPSAPAQVATLLPAACFDLLT